jgi:thioredoxin reductase (NADPH)
MQKPEYDIIIIGAGPAGLTAGIYTGRGGLKTLILERMATGGHAAMTDAIENYPGFPEGISGADIAESIEKQARKFGAEIKSIEHVTAITKINDHFTVKVGDVQEYTSRAVIIASGADATKLDVPGEEQFTGRGVSYCAVCDGPFFRDASVAVVGGGNSAVEESMYLTRYARKVYLIHRRDQFRADKILIDRVLNEPKIEIVLEHVVEEILGDKNITGARIKHARTGDTRVLAIEGVFIYAGYLPNSDFLNSLKVEIDDFGCIVTDTEMATNVPGLFAAGDVRKKGLRQVVTAAGDGATAAFSAEKYIENLKNQKGS